MAYNTPKSTYIGRDGKLAGKLYAAEERTTEALTDQAKLRLPFMPAGSRLWDDAMPQALLDMLDSYSDEFVRVVVEAWLAKHPKSDAVREARAAGFELCDDCDSPYGRDRRHAIQCDACYARSEAVATPDEPREDFHADG
jgi:hypothetical protein